MKSYEILPTGSIAGGAGLGASAKSTGCGCKGSGCGSTGGGCGSAIRTHDTADPARQFLGRKLKAWEIVPPSERASTLSSATMLTSPTNSAGSSITTQKWHNSAHTQRIPKNIPPQQPRQIFDWRQDVFRGGMASCVAPNDVQDIAMLFPEQGACGEFSRRCNDLARNLRQWELDLARATGQSEYWGRLHDECRLGAGNIGPDGCIGIAQLIPALSAEATRLGNFRTTLPPGPLWDRVNQEWNDVNSLIRTLNDYVRICGEAVRDRRAWAIPEVIIEAECQGRQERYWDRRRHLDWLLSWVESYRAGVRRIGEELGSETPSCGGCDPHARANRRSCGTLVYPVRIAP